MCGIVGYLGKNPALDVILEGLEQLEYRGYDSAGLTINTSKGFWRVRAEGSLDQLKKKIEKWEGSLGIGHTRWATHGIPSEENAHPHKAGKIQVVHNGIIENSEDLKKKFQYHCQSQTDTEIIACLISDLYSNSGDFFKSVFEAVKLLKGSFSFLAVCEDCPASLIGVRQGPPLAVGFGKDKEFFISSDLPSLVQCWTSQTVLLENGELVSIQDGQCRFFSLDGSQVNKEIQTLQKETQVKDKSGYSHYMLKEIFEQPHSVLRVLKAYTDKGRIHFNSSLFPANKKIFIVACGSSYYAGLYGKFVLESLAGISVEVDLASEFQYKKLLLKPKDIVLFISQSGETADTLSSLEQAKKRGAVCYALCNVKNSSLDRSVDSSFYLHSGLEVGVASTKAFTSTLVLLLLTALSRKKDHSLMTQLFDLPSLIEQVLFENKQIKEQAILFSKYKRFLYLGRGPHYPIALEGALKMKELAYIHAEGYPSGEMKHGPLALVDSDVLVIGLSMKDFYYSKNMMNLQEAKARGGCILTLGDEYNPSVSDQHIALPSCHPFLSPILEAVALQLTAYHFACSLGHNVDRPRNLAKSVTVE